MSAGLRLTRAVNQNRTKDICWSFKVWDARSAEAIDLDVVILVAEQRDRSRHRLNVDAAFIIDQVGTVIDRDDVAFDGQRRCSLDQWK